MKEKTEKTKSEQIDHAEYLRQLKIAVKEACLVALPVTRDPETSSFIELKTEVENGALRKRRQQEQNGFITLGHRDKPEKVTVEDWDDYASLIEMACRQMYYSNYNIGDNEINSDERILAWIEKRVRYCTEHELPHYLKFLECPTIEKIVFSVWFIMVDGKYNFLPYVAPIGTMQLEEYIDAVIAPSNPSKLDIIAYNILTKTNITNE